MPDSSPRLPERASLEQLQKQAKELVRRFRAGDRAAVERFAAVNPRFADAAAPAVLADAQFVLARELGFESWATLKHRLAARRRPDLAHFEQLARDLAQAYMTGDATAIRELNWSRGTAYVWDHEPARMQERLPTWFAAETRTEELALADARQMIARAHEFANWSEFTERVARGPAARPAAPGLKSAPPAYIIDEQENSIAPGPILADEDWDAVFAAMEERGITGLDAHGQMTDQALKRLSRLEHVTRLGLGGCVQLTDAGLAALSRMPRLRELDLNGWKGQITDRGLEVLSHLPALRKVELSWQQHVSDAGIAHLAFCEHLEAVNLMGTPTGDGAVEALAGKRQLRKFHTGRLVTDTGLPLLHRFPVFETWQGGEIRYDLMSFGAEPNHLLLDGPFTDEGLGGIAGLAGLFGLGFFWHCSSLTAAGLERLADLPNLGFLGCDGERCNDEAMRHIAAIPRLRMLMGQGAVAGDDGFAALARSRTLEYFWGRECPNLTGRGFTALSTMPLLRGLAVSCKNVDDAALSTLPRFAALRQLMPMDVTDEGFRHVGRCEGLESLWCMYCRDSGDAGTEHIAGLRLKYYYAGDTRITDRSLEILGRMTSLERLEFWQCAGVTNAGIARLARLPQLRELSLDGMPGVTRDVAAVFPSHVRVKYS